MKSLDPFFPWFLPKWSNSETGIDTWENGKVWENKNNWLNINLLTGTGFYVITGFPEVERHNVIFTGGEELKKAYVCEVCDVSPYGTN